MFIYVIQLGFFTLDQFSSLPASVCLWVRPSTRSLFLFTTNCQSFKWLSLSISSGGGICVFIFIIIIHCEVTSILIYLPGWHKQRYLLRWSKHVPPFRHGMLAHSLMLVSHRSPEEKFNTLRPRQNGLHFADDIFNFIFANEKVWTLTKSSLKFVPKGPISKIPALFQIMTEPMFTDAYMRHSASMSQRYTIHDVEKWLFKAVTETPFTNMAKLRVGHG